MYTFFTYFYPLITCLFYFYLYIKIKEFYIIEHKWKEFHKLGFLAPVNHGDQALPNIKKNIHK